MAALSTADRQKIRRGLARYWSKLHNGPGNPSKIEMLATVNATDDWIDDNQASFNTALPAAAQAGLTAGEKTLLFCAVALMRADPDTAALLKRALGVGVD